MIDLIEMVLTISILILNSICLCVLYKYYQFKREIKISKKIVVEIGRDEKEIIYIPLEDIINKMDEKTYFKNREWLLHMIAYFSKILRDLK